MRFSQYNTQFQTQTTTFNPQPISGIIEKSFETLPTMISDILMKDKLLPRFNNQLEDLKDLKQRMIFTNNKYTTNVKAISDFLSNLYKFVNTVEPLLYTLKNSLAHQKEIIKKLKFTQPGELNFDFIDFNSLFHELNSLRSELNDNVMNYTDQCKGFKDEIFNDLNELSELIFQVRNAKDTYVSNKEVVEEMIDRLIMRINGMKNKMNFIEKEEVLYPGGGAIEIQGSGCVGTINSFNPGVDGTCNDTPNNENLTNEFTAKSKINKKFFFNEHWKRRKMLNEMYY